MRPFLLIMTAGILSACAVPTSYAGVSLRPGTAAPEIQAIARRAQAGDKLAQLELGIRFEEGRGLPLDLGRAASLYALAARTSGGMIWVYSPPVGRSKGQVISVDGGLQQPGLSEAARRLMALKAKK